MPRISDKDWSIFSNFAKTQSERFTESEVNRIHEMAVELNVLLNAVIARESNPQK